MSKQPATSNRKLVGQAGTAAGQASTEEQILDFLQAVNPGVSLVLDKKRANSPRVKVKPIEVQHIMRFSRAIGNVLPHVIPILRQAVEDDSAVGNVAIQLMPYITAELGDLVNENVEPTGVFLRLPHDLAAPIIATWIEMNLLDRSKWDAWRDAFGPVLEALHSIVPSKADEDKKGEGSTSET